LFTPDPCLFGKKLLKPLRKMLNKFRASDVSIKSNDMKRYLLLIVALGFSISNFAQNKNEISVFYGKSAGPATFSVLRNGFLDGASSGFLKENNSIGLRYISSIKNNQKLKIEAGIDYLFGKLEIKPVPIGDTNDDASREEKFNLISTPIFINHYFGKYFFINEGIIIDYQKSETDTYTGFGAGIGFGIGAKFEYNNYTFYLNPTYKRHLFLSKKYGLIELGIKFGIGYKF
jgi:hypothetical protein